MHSALCTASSDKEIEINTVIGSFEIILDHSEIPYGYGSVRSWLIMSAPVRSSDVRDLLSRTVPKRRCMRTAHAAIISIVSRAKRLEIGDGV